MFFLSGASATVSDSLKGLSIGLTAKKKLSIGLTEKQLLILEPMDWGVSATYDHIFDNGFLLGASVENTLCFGRKFDTGLGKLTQFNATDAKLRLGYAFSRCSLFLLGGGNFIWHKINFSGIDLYSIAKNVLVGLGLNIAVVSHLTIGAEFHLTIGTECLYLPGAVSGVLKASWKL